MTVKMGNTTLLITLLGLFTVLTTCGQTGNKSKIPVAVTVAFQKQYPKSCDAEWKRVGKGYEVVFGSGSFCDNNKILLDSAGKVIYHKMVVEEDKFPTRIKSAILKQFSGYRVSNAEKIVSHGNVTYIAEFKNEKEALIVAFGVNGKVLARVED